MKTINKISIFILLLALLFVGCRKDTNPVVEPKVKEQSKEVYDTKAIFEWVVDFPGIISSVVEVGLKADMSDAVRYGSIKETTEKSFTAVANNLKEDTKYYYRYVVWNPNGSFNMEVNVFETYPPIPTYTIQLSANPNNGGTVSGGGKFKQGQSCTVTATPATDYYFINWTEGENVVSTDTSYIFEVTGNRTLKANFIERPLIPTGAINGLFSVSATQQVYFSQGNLQYIGNTNTWKFADHQWDVIGESFKIAVAVKPYVFFLCSCEFLFGHLIFLKRESRDLDNGLHALDVGNAAYVFVDLLIVLLVFLLHPGLKKARKDK